MGLDLNRFSNISDPISKVIKEAGNQLIDTAENAVIGNLSAAFARLGLGSGTNKNVLGNLGEQVLAGIAGEIFGAIGREMNLSSKGDIEDFRGVLVNSDFKRDVIDADNISKINKGASPTNIIFPSDLNDFYIQLDFKKYSRPAPNVLATVATDFSISLPLPRTLEDRHNLSYDTLNQGLIGAIFNQGAGNANKDSVDALVDNAAYAAAYIGKRAITEFTSSGEAFVALTSQNFGATLNPHLSILFQAPTLKTHKMQWMLSANNPQESETIRKITQLIRAASLPAFITNQKGQANLNLLDMPMMCKMTLYPWGDESKFAGVHRGKNDIYNKNLYTFKHTVIDGVNINYSPSSLAFFDDDSGGNNPAPAFVVLEISFLEIEYFTADDFGRHGKSLDFNETLGKFTKDIMGAFDEEKLAVDGISAIADVESRTTAQNENTNIFALEGQANNIVMQQYAAGSNNDEQQNYLYKTADGSWFYHDVTNKKVEPIKTFDNTFFDQFGVPADEQNTIPITTGTPVLLSNLAPKALQTTVDGINVVAGPV
jgi:hypothetical protein